MSNIVEGGSSQNGGPAGDLAGTDLFMMKGSTVVINPGASHTVTFNGTIADDSAASIASASWATGNGAGLSIESGLVQFNNANTYTGQTALNGGVLQAIDGEGIHTNSNINIAGGMLETTGTFNRYLGTGSNRIQWTGSGGFSAKDGDLTVTLNKGETLTWNTDSFIPNESNLVFGSATATDDVYFTNNINLDGQTRTILNKKNEEGTNLAVLSGTFSNGGLIIGDSSHTGTIRLTASSNNLSGNTQVSGGTLELEGYLGSPNVTVDGDTKLVLAPSSGLNSDVHLTLNGTLDLDNGGQTLGNLDGNVGGTGILNLLDGTVTVKAGDFKGVITGTDADNGLTKASSGTLILSGANTYVGTTSVAAGTLTLSGSLASSTVNISSGASLNDQNSGLASGASVTNDGTLTLGASDSVASYTGTGTLAGTGYTLTASTYTLNAGSTIQANLGAGTVTTTGAVVLNGTSASTSVTINSGSALTLGSSERLNDSATVEVNGTLALGGDEGIATLNGSGTVALDNSTMSLHGGNFSGAITGTGSSTVTKSTTDTLTLSGTNTYTGTTQINAGTVTLSDTGSLASTTVNIVSGATLNDNGGSYGLSSSAAVTNNGTLVMNGNDTVSSLTNTGTVNGSDYTLTATTYALNDESIINANLGTGTVTTSGAVALNGTSSASSITVNSGSTLTLGSAERIIDSSNVAVNGTMNLGGAEQIAALTGSGTISVNSGTLSADSGTFSGVISGTDLTYGLTKTSVGSLTLTGENTYAGVTNVNAGILVLSGSGSLQSPTVNVANGATLNDTNGGLQSNTALTAHGSVNLGAAETIASLDGNSTGRVTMIGGGLTLSSGTFAGTIAGGNTPYTLTKNTSGTLTLTGTNIYTGTTQINAGTVTLSDTGRLASTTVNIVSGATLNDNGGSYGLSSSAAVTNNGTLVMNGNDTVSSLTNTGTVNGSDYTLTATTYALNDESIINANLGTGTVTTSGAVALNGTSSASSITVNSGSTLTLGSAERIIDSSNVTVNGTMNLGGAEQIAALTGSGTISVNSGTLSADSGTFSGVISGTDLTYGLTKTSVGTLTLTGGNTYAGVTNVNAGTLVLSGSGSLQSPTVNVANGATLNDTNGGLQSNTALTAHGSVTLGAAETIASLDGNSTGMVTMSGGGLTLSSGTFAGTIAGGNTPYTLTKNTSGTLTLTGTNTYTGTTQINAGTVTLSDTGSLASTTVNIVSGATLNDNGGSYGLSSSAAVTNEGTLTLADNDTISSYTGAGTLNGSGKTLTATTYNLHDGATVNANLGTGTLNTTGTVTLYGTSATDTVVIPASSELKLMGEQLLPISSTVSVDGTLSLNGGNQEIYGLNGQGNVNVNTYILTVSNGGNFTGHINASGTSLQATGGTLNLTGTVDTETIEVNNGGSIALTGSTTSTSDVTVAANSNLSLDSTTTVNSTGNIEVQDTGTLTIADGSTLTYNMLHGSGTVSNAGTFNNETLIKGNLTFEGDFVNTAGATLSPGNSPGITTFGGSYTEAGTLNIDVEGTTPGIGSGHGYHSQVKVAGTVTLQNTSTLQFSEYVTKLARGNVYQIIADSSGDPKSVTGTFGAVRYVPIGGSAVQNAAVVFDVSQGQVVATGLNEINSVFADLGANENQRRAATSLFNVAQIAENQIDSTTFEGGLARQIIDATGSPSDDLAHYTPDYYGAISDFAFVGDRALVKNLWNQISPTHDLDNNAFARHGLFGGYLQNTLNNPDNAKVHRRDFFVGGDLSNHKNFSTGMVVSKTSGDLKAALGNSDVKGASALVYVRGGVGSFTAIATAGYSSHDHDLRRETVNGVVTSSTTAKTWSGSVGLQYKGWTVGQFQIAPTGSLVYSSTSVGGFNEAGASDALNNQGYGSKLCTGNLDLSALYSNKLWGKTFNVEFLAGVEQVISRDKDEMELCVARKQEINYTMEFAKREATHFTYGLNMGYEIFKNTQITAGYSDNTGPSRDQSVQVALRISF